MHRFLQERLDNDIPISKHIGLKVVKASPNQVAVSAPLAPNVNHKATVFGGTLASALLLSGWCLAEVRLGEWGLKGHIVVMKTEIDYLRPVSQDFLAVCTLDDESKWEEFRGVLERRKKARIWLEGSVSIEDVVAVKMQGLYVASLLS